MRKRILSSLLISIIALTAWSATPKYIFYFIGDGMGMGPVMAAQNYNRLVLGNDSELPMMSMPINSYSTTFSASSPVTDSAAGGTALATGTKTRNNMLGMGPDTVPVFSVAKHLHDAGYGVAIVTTVAADDATPGAFYAHVPSRSHSVDIDRFAAESDFELIGGAALRGFKDKKGNDTGAEEYILANGYDIVRGPAALRASNSRKAILFPEFPVWDWNMGYAVDAYPGRMTLLDMTEGAVGHLTRHTPERFFIMAEGGNIDHAAHANDAGATIKEILAFNEAIAYALDFYNQHPDETLIIVTSDHDTGGMALGNNSVKYNAHLQYFEPQKISKEVFSTYCDSLVSAKAHITWPEMKQKLIDELGFYTVVPISEKDDELLQAAFNKTFVEGEESHVETLYANLNKFPVEVFDMLHRLAGIGWTTYSHTGNPVPFFAIGAGSEIFTGHNDNKDIPRKILKLCNIE